MTEALKVDRQTLKRLEKVERKLGATPQQIETKKRVDTVNTLLRMLEYHQRFEEMTMTEEEIRKTHEEENQHEVEWYCKFMRLSPEEQREERRENDQKLAIDVENYKAWLNSETRKQFDKEYEEFQKRKNQNPTTDLPLPR